MLTEPRHAVIHQRAPAFGDRARVTALRRWGAVFLGIFALLAVLVAAKASQGADQSANNSLNRFALRSPGLTDFFKAVTGAGAPTVPLGLGLLVAVAFFLLR